MASKSKKKKKDPQPRVPEYQKVGDLKQPSEAPRSEYEPMSLNDFGHWMDASYRKQLEYAPQLAEQARRDQLATQSAMFNNMAGLQQGQAYNYGKTANNLLSQYNPEFGRNYSQLSNQVYAGLKTNGDAISKNIYQDLADGRNLGEGLSREIEQGIRGAQMARGNWLGPAPTAQEAFGKGQAAEALYGQRLGRADALYNSRTGQAQNFLQGRNPMDMMGQTAGSFMGQQYYPNAQNFVDPGLGASAMANVGSQAQQFNSTAMQGYSTYQNALQNYNQNQIGATAANNEGMFGQYDRNADAWMYRESVRNGLYSTPGVAGGGGMMGGGGGGMMGTLGAAGSAVGAGLTGLAASGAIGAGATAAGVGVAGAAAGAAAALCWLARKLIPDQWKQFRKWLFTKAPDEVRRDYIFNARRLANLIH